MAKAYLIGGAPRAGKTTAIRRLLETKHIIAAPTDSIRLALRSLVAEKDFPTLFRSERGAFNSERNVEAMQHNPQWVIDHQNAESEIVWQATAGFVEDNLTDGRDVAVEGVAVLPHNLASLRFDYCAVIVVNLADQSEIILKHARENPYDWLCKYDDRAIRAFCNFNRELNNYFFEEAKKYHIPTVTVDNNNFKDSIDEVVQLLLKS